MTSDREIDILKYIEFYNEPSINWGMIDLCAHGCGNPTQFFSQTGRGRCLKASSSCPAIKAKNSSGLKIAYAEGRKDCSHFDGKRGWSKGLTRETDNRVDRISQKIKEGHRERIKNDVNVKALYRAYRYDCQWDRRVFKELYNIPGHELLKQHGLYHKTKNTKGVVRDHRLSIYDGFKLDVPVELMNHPANCRFLLHADNARKSSKSEISIDELKQLVHNWKS